VAVDDRYELGEAFGFAEQLIEWEYIPISL